ncbi:hypothetical protein [Sneathiella glossodoripedis]|uniref:hypothetical protein n=1 Tax=Sneathiella glossodoripedis TaxID=418853 RepID=UPI000471222D|nr:hypothetical protein [Sneathiella glossodoripedis]
MNFEKLTPIEGGSGGCLYCGYQHEILPLDKGGVIAVGFGSATLTKNNQTVYCETEVTEENFMTFQEAEEIASNEPENDWRIHLIAPLSERHYQRQGEGHWVLYEKGMGFA